MIKRYLHKLRIDVDSFACHLLRITISSRSGYILLQGCLDCIHVHCSGLKRVLSSIEGNVFRRVRVGARARILRVRLHITYVDNGFREVFSASSKAERLLPVMKYLVIHLLKPRKWASRRSLLIFFFIENRPYAVCCRRGRICQKQDTDQNCLEAGKITYLLMLVIWRRVYRRSQSQRLVCWATKVEDTQLARFRCCSWDLEIGRPCWSWTSAWLAKC